ncbi:MAG: hypothetical protein ABL967_07675 [Bryobacteraceae bacterium]
MRVIAIVAAASILSFVAVAQNAAAPKPAPAKPAAKGAFDPKNLTGKYRRESPFQTYSNVPGGANELQAFILGQAAAPRKLEVPTEEAPFTKEGQAAFEKNIPSYGRRITAPRLGNDPQGMCDPFGVPRMLNGQVAGPHATLEVMVTPFRVFMFSEWHHNFRVVFTDGRKLPTGDIEPKWNGYSVGSWEGDTFVVKSVGFDERTWLDHNGYPHTENMQLEERYRKLDAETLELTETIIDPEYYAKPFKSDRKIWKLIKGWEKGWDEQIYCVPSEEFKFNSLIRDANVGKDTKK